MSQILKNDDRKAAISDGRVKSPKLVWNQAVGAPLGLRFDLPP